MYIYNTCIYTHTLISMDSNHRDGPVRHKNFVGVVPPSNWEVKQCVYDS